MNNSFYGGKQGFSFVVVKSFSSETEMITSFKRGPSYTDVHFDEYVLINTDNKNHKDNGKLYRRGYDYTDDLGGAILIGSIVGPAGLAPNLELDTIENINMRIDTAPAGYQYRIKEGSYLKPTSLVPGKDKDGNFNDFIEWKSFSARDASGNDTTAYLGFKIPYLVIDLAAESESAYVEPSATRVDNTEHPFYEQWKMKIPKGIKGDALKNFKVLVAAEGDGVEFYDGQEEDRSGGRSILVYDYYDYTNNEEGEKKTIYLGDYNMIDAIELDEEGTFIIQYAHDDDYKEIKLMKWIKEVSLNPDNGLFTVIYNHDTDKNGKDTKYEKRLGWVKDINIAVDGKVTVTYTDKEAAIEKNQLRWATGILFADDGSVTVQYNNGEPTEFNKLIKWITNIDLTDNGEFTIKYNNGTSPSQFNLKWVKGLVLNDDGTLDILYNDGTQGSGAVNPIKWIKSVYIDTNDEKLYVEYNTGEIVPLSEPIKFVSRLYIDDTDETLHVEYNTGEDEVLSSPIRFIDSVEIGTDQRIHITYNTGEKIAIGSPINYIEETAISENYHYLVYYSDPAKRQALIDAGIAVTYGGRDGWADLGSIKEENGILIGLNLSLDDPVYETLGDIAAAVIYLNTNYPNGLQTFDLQGKVVTIGHDNENKAFYAFDYSLVNGLYKGWYYLGEFNDSSKVISLIERADAVDIETKKQSLAVNGVWFIVEGAVETEGE